MLLAEQAHGWWIVWPLLWLALIVAVVWFVRPAWRRREPGRYDRAKEILAERYASGELTSEEYRERLAQLG
jgi:putative membrane protein